MQCSAMQCATDDVVGGISTAVTNYRVGGREDMHVNKLLAVCSCNVSALEHQAL
jgi:hypothetical protein